MPICKNCNREFPNWATIDGKAVSLRRRNYCLDCNPFGEHRFNPRNPLPKSQRKKLVRCRECGKEFSSAGRKICTTCKSIRRRKEHKKRAIELLGGKCRKCGYDRCMDALVFHHLDPHQKEIGLAYNWGNGWPSIEKEVLKCELVCANCHSEIHSAPVAKLVDALDLNNLSAPLVTTEVESPKVGETPGSTEVTPSEAQIGNV